MALVVITGRSLTLEVDSVDYSIQTAEVTLTPSQTTTQYVTLTGSAAVAGPVTWALRVRAFQDWDEATSFCDAIYAAAVAGTPIPFEVVATGPTGAATFTGDLIPTYPSVGGAADSALEVDITFEVDGALTKA